MRSTTTAILIFATALGVVANSADAAGVAAGAAASGSVGGSAASTPPVNVSPSVAAAAARLGRLDADAERAKAASEKPAAPKSAAQRRREQQEQQKAEALERKATDQRAKLAREMTCVIQPVMTNAEISHCGEVWR